MSSSRTSHLLFCSVDAAAQVSSIYLYDQRQSCCNSRHYRHPAHESAQGWRKARTIMPLSNDDQGAEKPEKPPHYHGHRARLRQRFLEAGSEAVSDYEL